MSGKKREEETGVEESPPTPDPGFPIGFELPPMPTGPAHAHFTGAPASVLVHLGAFLGDLGVLMQQGEPQRAPPTQEQKYLDAKTALKRELEGLLEDIIADGGLSTREKIDRAVVIGKAIGGLRSCTSVGLGQALGDIGELETAGTHPWYGRWKTLWVLCRLAHGKRQWDDAAQPPGRPHRVEFNEDRNVIQVVLAGVVPAAIFRVHPSKKEEGRRKARELEQMFQRCDYPDKEFAEAIVALEQPAN